jgi:hypothetical protein
MLGKDDLNSSYFAAANATVEECKKEGVEHHRPHHLKINGNLELRAILEKCCPFPKRDPVKARE